MTSPRIIPPTPPFASSTAPAVALDAAGRIAGDISCRKCGYNLRGLAPDGRCPECATAIGRSLQGDFLRFCDPAWVRRLASGVNWIIVSVALGFLIGIAAAVIVRVLNLPPLVIEIIAWLAGAVGLYGYWLYTTPDPTLLTTEEGVTARKLVRVSQVSAWAAIPISLVAEEVSPDILSIMVQSASSIITIVGVFATFIYTRRLARRIPDDKLARSFGTIMWAIVILMTVGLILGIVGGSSAAAATYGQSSGSLDGLVMGGACFVGALGLIVGILLLINVLRFRRALSKAADTAAATWASATVPAGMPAPVGAPLPGPPENPPTPNR